MPDPADVLCDSQDSASLVSFSISSSFAKNSSSDSPSLVIAVGSGDEYEEQGREAETQLKVAPAVVATTLCFSKE